MRNVVGILFAVVVISGAFAEIFYRTCWLCGESMCGAVFFYAAVLLVTTLLSLVGYGLYRWIWGGDQSMTNNAAYADYYDEEYGIPEEERLAFIISLVLIGIVMIPYYDAKEYISSSGKRIAKAVFRKR